MQAPSIGSLRVCRPRACSVTLMCGLGWPEPHSRASRPFVLHRSLSFLFILPVNQEDASPAQTPSHHLSLRPRRKVVGKLVTSRHSCLTLGSSFLPFWRCSPSLALTWSRLLSTFPRQAGHSSPHLPASSPLPSLPQPQAPPSSGSGPFPSHREAFKVATPCGLFSARCMESLKRNKL